MGSQGRIGPYSAPMLIVSGEKWGEGSPWCSGRVTGLEYEGGGGGAHVSTWPASPLGISKQLRIYVIGHEMSSQISATGQTDEHLLSSE